MSLVEAPVTFRPSTSTDLSHVVCDRCSPDLALCGEDMTDTPWNNDEEPECVVCVDLEPLPCPRCGW